MKISLTERQQAAILKNLNKDQLKEIQDKLLAAKSKGSGIKDLVDLLKNILGSFGDMKPGILRDFIIPLLKRHLESQGSGTSLAGSGKQLRDKYIRQLKAMQGSGIFTAPGESLIERLIKDILNMPTVKEGREKIRDITSKLLSPDEQAKFLSNLSKTLSKKVYSIVKRHHKKGSGIKEVIRDILTNIKEIGSKVGPEVLKQLVIPIAKALIMKKIQGKGINLAGNGVRLAGKGRAINTTKEDSTNYGIRYSSKKKMR